VGDEVSEHPKWAQDEGICPCGERAGPDFRYGLCDKHAKETPAPTLLRMGATTGALAKEQARAEKAEGDRDFWRQRYDAAAKLSGDIESDLAAARRECEAAKEAHAYCLLMFTREWLTDPRNRSIFAARIFAMLDRDRGRTRAALAAPAAGEEGKR
jgi:hypothetical protein